MLKSMAEWRGKDDVPRARFALLIAMRAACPTPEELKLIEDTASRNNCVALALVGPGSEALHDYADEIAEENGHTSLITTWHHDESPEDVAAYFLHVPGTAPELLIAIAEEGDAVRKELVHAVQG
jgi:hypothetical protein